GKALHHVRPFIPARAGIARPRTGRMPPAVPASTGGAHPSTYGFVIPLRLFRSRLGRWFVRGYSLHFRRFVPMRKAAARLASYPLATARIEQMHKSRIGGDADR